MPPGLGARKFKICNPYHFTSRSALAIGIVDSANGRKLKACECFYVRQITTLEAHRDSFSPHLCTVRTEPRHLPHVDRGERAEKSKNIQQPQNYADDHDPIQDRLDRTCHRNVAINQSEQNTDYDQDHYELN